MIKVSVLYPSTAGSRFDHDYYRDKHMPMVQSKMGESCLRYEIDKGISGDAQGSQPRYVAMCHIFCDSLESFQGGFGPHALDIQHDVSNYTDLMPLMQISEVIVG